MPGLLSCLRDLAAPGANCRFLAATPLLPAGTNVLVYSGDEDFVCNSLGTSKWLNALLWSKQQAWGG